MENNYREPWNDRLEIEGDAREDVQNDTFEHNLRTPEEKAEYEAWLDAPLSAQIARMVAGDDPELFDQIKADLKGE